MTDDHGPALTKFPTIDGQKVKLRELLIDDAIGMSSLMTHNVSKSLWEIPYPYALENALSFIDSSHKEYRFLKAVNFAILYKNNIEPNGLVGIISLKNLNIEKKKANLGYWIGESFWGKGIASESVKLVINYAFSVLRLEEVYAYVYSQNKASIRVLEKNGMTRVGEINEYSKKLGRYQNTIKFLIKRPQVLMR
ncbi:MAG TPA: GNAT family N-acetyltransferase [Nitrososphaeraceae archaeon]|nr:GNAT family N-acetyltransferase [Nitrososphaeraceae archaeon]